MANKEELAFGNIFEACTESKEEAADLQFRADIMLLIRSIIEEKKWTPAETGVALGVTQPRISELMNGHVTKFSSDKLITYISKLGYSIVPRLDMNEAQITAAVKKTSA